MTLRQVLSNLRWTRRGAVVRASETLNLSRLLGVFCVAALGACAATGVADFPFDEVGDVDATTPEEPDEESTDELRGGADEEDQGDDENIPPGGEGDGQDNDAGDGDDQDEGEEPTDDEPPPGHPEESDPEDDEDSDDGLPELAPPDWYEPQPPIVPSAYDVWSFHPVDGMRCANGQQSGFFSNFSATSDDVLIFFLGGGICYDEVSCLTDLNMVLNGLGPDPLAWWMSHGERHGGIFNRANPENPFKGASYIVLPHCTVDFHVGHKSSSYLTTGPIEQYGYRNVQLAMNHIVPTFAANPDRSITVAGFSAGGVGAMGNYHQIARAFEWHGHLPPFLINDGGPVQRRPFFSVNSHNVIRHGWNLPETIEAWCTTCAEHGYHEVLAEIHRLHPGARTSQICSYSDTVVMALYTLFDAIGNAPHFVEFIPHFPFTFTSMRQGLRDLAAWGDELVNAGGGMHRSLLYYGERHGALTAGQITSGPNGDTPWIHEFLIAQLNRSDPFWHSSIAP